MLAYKLFFFLFLICNGSFVFAQNDSTRKIADTTKHADTTKPTDTTKLFIPADSIPVVATPIRNMSKVDSLMKYHSPRKAAIRSALIPGWGQVYNKKLWKIPIIYAALGISGSVFVYNLSNYRDLRFAYKAKYNASKGDSSLWPRVRQDLVTLDMNSIKSYRDEFRRNIDYSALFFVLLWGLNVVDATVDAHLKPFDVSPDLSFKFKFGHSQMAGTSGVSLVLAFK